MLRWAVAALLIANIAFWSWTQGWLDDLTGWRAAGDREPERLALQVHPERIRVIAPAAASAPASGPASSPASAPAGVAAAADVATTADAALASGADATATAQPPSPAASAAAPADVAAALPCFETVAFAPAQLPAAEAALVRAALPPGSWRVVRVDKPGIWMVYVGLFPTYTQARARREQLRALGFDVEDLRGMPGLEPGLSFGRFDTRADADRLLDSLTPFDLGPLRVLTIEAPATLHLLRIDGADAALQARIAALKLRALGGGFGRCAG